LQVSETIAYLAGVSEDAHLGRGGKEGYVFDIESKSRRCLDEVVKPALQRVLPKHKPVRVYRRGTRREYRLQVYDQHLNRTLREIQAHPQIIQSWTPAQQRAWLRGLGDAEGSATRNSEGQPQFSIYNRNKQKLEIAGQILQQRHIHCGYYKPPNRHVWQLYITGRENLQRFFDVGPGVTHPEKRTRLQKLLAK
jgi:hypothetical protein